MFSFSSQLSPCVPVLASAGADSSMGSAFGSEPGSVLGSEPGSVLSSEPGSVLGSEPLVLSSEPGSVLGSEGVSSLGSVFTAGVPVS
eukprot:145711-Amorphochlora_amoeboformis.AAC.1